MIASPNLTARQIRALKNNGLFNALRIERGKPPRDFSPVVREIGAKGHIRLLSEIRPDGQRIYRNGATATQ